MSSPELTAQTEATLHHRLKCFADGDIDGIMSDFADDAVLIGMEGVVDNIAGIRAMFTTIITEYIPKGSTITMKLALARGTVAYILWSAESPSFSIPVGSDTFVMRDGKIIAQTFAAHIQPKG